jgi:phospholipase/carboxylesterase
MKKFTTAEFGAKNPKYLVIMLHGYGANGDNLIDLGLEFQPIINEGYYIAPNGIEAWEGGFPNCYQWFSLYAGLERKNLNQIAEKIVVANKILQEFISKQLLRFNLNYDKLILVGFSQGSMMAIYQGLISPQKIAGIVSFSGKVVEPTEIGDQIISRPNICLIHGTHDSVLPFSCLEESSRILGKHQISFEKHAVNNLDHTIDSRAIAIASNFIKKITKKNLF